MTRDHGAPPLADLCRYDPLDLDGDPRLGPPGAAAEPCGPLCTPWCLASHDPGSGKAALGNWTAPRDER